MEPADHLAPLPFHDRRRVRSRVRDEFLEMPGLVVTRAQAERLFGLEPELCEAVLTDLVDAGFLANDGGRFHQPR
jgi:hypothetical protein